VGQKLVGLNEKRPRAFSDARPLVELTGSGNHLLQEVPEQQPLWAQQPHWHWPPWQQPSEQMQEDPHLQEGPQQQEA
jgi:hypothetical protein